MTKMGALRLPPLEIRQKQSQRQREDLPHYEYLPIPRLEQVTRAYVFVPSKNPLRATLKILRYRVPNKNQPIK
jgi:hypothetical protein